MDAAAVGGTGRELTRKLRTEDYLPGAVGWRLVAAGWHYAERSMEIKFRHDVDNVLKEAKKQNKPVLLDFSAAPM